MCVWTLCAEEMPTKEDGKVVWFSFLGATPEENWCDQFRYDRAMEEWISLDDESYSLFGFGRLPIAWMPCETPSPYRPYSLYSQSMIIKKDN